MNYRFCVPAVVAFLAVNGSAFGAGTMSTYAAVTTELAIDGVACGRVYSVEGGDPRASAVVVTNSGGLALPKKQISGVTYAPITVEVALPPAPPILGWIGDLCANRQTPKTLLLTRFNVNGQVAGSALRANNVLLTEVRFPALDVASKDAARLTLVFAPESTQAVPSSSAAKSAGTATKAGLVGNFKIQIGGLPSSRVSRIEAITIKQPGADSVVGDAKKIGAEPGAPQFSNLILTISSADLTDWNTWRDSFVVNGKSDDASEISGSLDLLANDQTKLMTLQFSHVGILRASPEKEGGSDAVARFQAELYCEGMALGAAPTTSTPPAATGPATTLPLITAMAPVPAQTATLMPAAPTTPAGTSTAGSSSGGAAKGGDAAGGGADPRVGSAAAGSAAGGTAKGGDAAASGGADVRAGSSVPVSSGGTSAKAGDAAPGGGADLRASSGQSSAPSAASGSSAGSAASSGGGAAKDAAAPTTAAPAATVPTSRATGLTAVPAVAPPLAASTAAPTPILIDQGARDPKDFPRPEGIVRKSFSSVRQKTYSQEIAAYSAKSTPDALEELYTKSLTAAGWEPGTRVENNGSITNTHQIVLNWKNGLRSVTVTLAEVKAGGAEIGVNLTTKFAP